MLIGFLWNIHIKVREPPKIAWHVWGVWVNAGFKKDTNNAVDVQITKNGKEKAKRKKEEKKREKKILMQDSIRGTLEHESNALTTTP